MKRPKPTSPPLRPLIRMLTRALKHPLLHPNSLKLKRTLAKLKRHWTLSMLNMRPKTKPKQNSKRRRKRKRKRLEQHWRYLQRFQRTSRNNLKRLRQR